MDTQMTQQRGIKPFKLPEPKSDRITITHTEPEPLMQFVYVNAYEKCIGEKIENKTLF